MPNRLDIFPKIFSKNIAKNLFLIFSLKLRNLSGTNRVAANLPLESCKSKVLRLLCFCSMYQCL
nr:MAG TPA: hypothetical protein [Caudoviricetes sp.]